MPIVSAVVPPWQAALTPGERTLVYYFLVIAGLALLAMLLRTLASLREISSRYRPAIFAGTGVVADVEAGIEVHPETIWADQTKQADAVSPPAARLEAGCARAGSSLE